MYGCTQGGASQVPAEVEEVHTELGLFRNARKNTPVCLVYGPLFLVPARIHRTCMLAALVWCTIRAQRWVEDRVSVLSGIPPATARPSGCAIYT